MTIARYEEGLAAGLTKREAGYLGFAEDLASIFRKQREDNEAFASDIGYSMAELRAQPVEDRPFIQDLYSAWKEGN